MKRVALITGVAGGIGQATATLFSAEGWHVIGVDWKPDAGFTGIDDYIQTDCSDPKSITFVIEKVKKTVGRLDALVNNAAIQICKPIIEMGVEEWDQIMSVNLRSGFIFSKAVYSYLKESQGCIVNVSSIHAIATSENIAAYAASKGAMSAFTRALAIEFAPAKVRVNAILPGAVDTPMLRDGLERGHLSGANIEELMNDLGSKTVMGRIGTPQEIAQGILFLADNKKSAFITGHSLVIDGGALVRLSTE